MADLDTYNDEPRQYEGKQALNTRDTGENYTYEHQDYSELASIHTKHHHGRYPSSTRKGRVADALHYPDDRERDYPPRDRSRSPMADRDGDVRIRDEPMNGRDRYDLLHA